LRAEIFAVLDQVLGFLGPLISALLVLVLLAAVIRQHRAQRASTTTWTGRYSVWAPIFIGIGILLFAVGEMIRRYYEVVLDAGTPLPSWADAAYFSEDPITLIAIVL
jgi:uncharacterized membrane protein YphA (DoxX/SURF4 family)